MQVMSNGRVRRSEGEWKEIVSGWRKSGLKARPFCRREQIELSSFLRWQRKLDASRDGNSFVPVTTTSSSSPSSPWTLEITLPNGCELRFQG